MSTAVHKSEKSVPFEVRNVHFKVDENVPQHWHGAGKAITIFFDNLSIFFPPGESFFVRSVKHYRELAKDPAFAEEVKAFCGQEGIHSREHRRYNAKLEAHGYPAEAMERAVHELLQVVKRTVPRRMQLSVTAALEHFTALMAHTILTDERLLDEAHPVMRELWLWHAAEENEHKAVAWDLYEMAGGNYPERVLVMVLATLIFWAKVLEHQVVMMRADGILGSVREWASLLNFLWGKPGALRRIVGHYFDWYRPGFHPWDLDNRDVLEKWLAHFEGAGAANWEPA